MALELTKELDSGVSAEYWKIGEVRLFPDVTVFTLCLYKDQASRDANKPCVSKEARQYAGAENPCTTAAMDALDANPHKLIYEKLKLEDEFDGAVDV